MEPWYNPDDLRIREAVNELYQMEVTRKQEQMSRFNSEIPNSEVVVLTDADHWIFVSHPERVFEEIVRFVSRITEVKP